LRTFITLPFTASDFQLVLTNIVATSRAECLPKTWHDRTLHSNDHTRKNCP
jgi:hypothetical protein